MPRRVSAKGSFRFDRVFPGIGRIALASGAMTIKEHRRREAMLDDLYDNGQWEVLKDLKERRFSPRQLYAFYRTGKVGQLSAEVVLRQPLFATVEAWLPVSAKAAKTRERYEGSWSTFKRLGVLPEGSVIRDLESVDWLELQREWPGAAYNWRHLRGFVSRFLSALLRDRYHPFRRMILDPERFPKGEAPEERVPDLTPEAFWRIVAAMPEHTRAAPVALVVTGMRVGELTACTEANLLPLTKSVLIPGKDNKTGQRKSAEATQPVDPDLWDMVKAAIPFGFSPWTLRDHWATARKGISTATLHDLRHCYGQWLVAAGRPEEAVQRGLRHKTASMTRRYVKQRDRQINASALRAILLPHSQPHSAETQDGRHSA